MSDEKIPEGEIKSQASTPAEEKGVAPEAGGAKPAAVKAAAAPKKPGEGLLGGAPKRGVEEEGEAGGAKEAEPISRRRFLSWLTLGWAAFAGALGAFATGMLRFMFPNVLFEPPMTFKAEPPSQYPLGTVNTDLTNKFKVWIVHNEDGIFALRAVCTHLGCTPRWLESEGKFKCPCHGSGFYMNGINFEGPAPRPLERYRVSVGEDGKILVDMSRRYAFEKGEWVDPNSIIKL